MNGVGENRYSGNWEKLSYRLRLLYPCLICGENDLNKKECHHLDGNKKNSTPSNAAVLCSNCHKELHKGNIKIPCDFEGYRETRGYSVTVAHHTSSMGEWFDSTKPLKILPNLKPEIANMFRKKHIKGFIRPGSCNYYIGLQQGSELIGVLGFSVPDYGTYDLMLKADTTPSEYEYSTDLLLYVLRTRQVQELLENKFNRRIDTVYSMCFSRGDQINRYRKHGELIKKEPKKVGFNLGYIFKLGEIQSVKSAKALWMQKHKKQ